MSYIKQNNETHPPHKKNNAIQQTMVVAQLWLTKLYIKMYNNMVNVCVYQKNDAILELHKRN